MPSGLQTPLFQSWEVWEQSSCNLSTCCSRCHLLYMQPNDGGMQIFLDTNLWSTHTHLHSHLQSFTLSYLNSTPMPISPKILSSRIYLYSQPLFPPPFHRPPAPTSHPSLNPTSKPHFFFFFFFCFPSFFHLPQKLQFLPYIMLLLLLLHSFLPSPT
jgi:hypothetical protein